MSGSGRSCWWRPRGLSRGREPDWVLPDVDRRPVLRRRVEDPQGAPLRGGNAVPDGDVKRAPAAGPARRVDRRLHQHAVLAVEHLDQELRLEDVREALSLIHISEPTRLGMISYAVFC